MDRLPGFAMPCWKRGSLPAELVARENAREIVRRIIRSQAATSAFSELWERWVAREDWTMEACWHESFSRVLGALRRGDVHSAGAETISLNVHLSECGEAGTWTASSGSLIRNLWSSWLLPAFDRIAVESDGSTAHLRLHAHGEEHTIVFLRKKSAWSLKKGPAMALTKVGTGKAKVTLLHRIFVGGHQCDSSPALVESITPEIATRWKEAFVFLQSYAPSYLPWIQNAIRWIGVLEPTPGKVISASYGTSHGFVHASGLASIPSSAEMVVHEAAHQYFMLISRLGPVDDGTDSALYYSPLVEKKRPLNRILFAFHACANILAFYRLCQAAGAPHQEYFAKNEKLVADQLNQLGAPLRANPALTAVGRALFEPWLETAF